MPWAQASLINCPTFRILDRDPAARNLESLSYHRALITTFLLLRIPSQLTLPSGEPCTSTIDYLISFNRQPHALLLPHLAFLPDSLQLGSV
jgi:hypothetical protein